MSKKKSIALAFIYVGAVVGAGFSSGQEIWRFFARHQAAGICGIGITIIFFVVLAPLFFQQSRKLNIESYQDFFYKYLPGPISYLFDFLYSSFLLGSVSVMLAGTGALFHNLLGLSYMLGVGLTITFVFITLFPNREGIVTVNLILIPALVLITVYTIIIYLKKSGVFINHEVIVSTIEQIDFHTSWVIDALLYGSYNLVMAIAVMTSIIYKEESNNIMVAGIIGGSILAILLFMLYLALITAFQHPPREEIPLLFITKSLGKGVYLSYIIALYFAMLTTAIANYYAFTKRFISLFKIKYKLGIFIGMIFILPLIPSGFSKLIDSLYPIFGCQGIIIIIFYAIILTRSKSNR